MNPTQQKLAQLQGDIKLAEKRLDDLQRDLSQLQTTKIKEFENYARDAKEAKRRVAELIFLLDEKHIEYDKLTLKAATLSKDIKEYNDNELKKAELKRDLLLQQASNELKAAFAKMDEAQALECEVAELTNTLESLDNQLTIERDNLTSKQNSLEKQEKELDAIRRETNDHVAKQREILDNLTRDVKEKSTLKENLDSGIQKSIELIKSNKLDAEKLLHEANRLKKLSQKERDESEKKAKEFTIREARVADREATVGRAYREVIQRGGRVDDGQA